RAHASRDLLESAFAWVRSGTNGTSGTVLGCRLAEDDLRRGLESAYRTLARQAGTRREPSALVDHAHRIRPHPLIYQKPGPLEMSWRRRAGLDDRPLLRELRRQPAAAQNADRRADRARRGGHLCRLRWHAVEPGRVLRGVRAWPAVRARPDGVRPRTRRRGQRP